MSSSFVDEPVAVRSTVCPQGAKLVKRALQRGLLFLALALLVGACTQLSSPRQSLVWQASNDGLTPHVSITSLAVDPLNPLRLFAGAYARENLYISVDGGDSWQPLDEGPAGHAIFTLRFDPQQPEELWVGTADGLYHGSPDGTGAVWQRVAEWPLATAAFALDADGNGVLYAAGAHPAVWMKEDGDPWQPLAALPGVGAVLSVAVAGDVLLAGSDGYGLFVSRDRGRSWQMASDIGETFVAALWVAPWDDRFILARTRAGLFRSTDGAATWEPIAAEIEGRVDAITGDALQTIYLGMSTGLVYRSTDGGDTWQPWGEGMGRDGMVNLLTVAPGTTQTFYAGTQYGLYRSQDHAQSWQPITQTLGSFRATALAQTPDGTLYLGNEDGVYRSADQGERWERRAAGLPPRAVLSLAVAPGDPQVLYAATEGDGVYVSSDGGGDWTQLAWDNFIIPELALDPHQPDRIYVRVAYERIYASDDGGLTWTARWDGMETTTEIMSMALSPHDPAVIYAGGIVDVFKSEDGALHWRRIGDEMAGQSIFHLAVDAHVAATVYAGATKGLYRSDDGGNRWRSWGEGLADITVTALAFHPNDAKRIYVGAKYRGVYASEDGGESWHPAATGMGEVSVDNLLVDVNGRWLYAATDRGFWRAALPP